MKSYQNRSGEPSGDFEPSGSSHRATTVFLKPSGSTSSSAALGRIGRKNFGAGPRRRGAGNAGGAAEAAPAATRAE